LPENDFGGHPVALELDNGCPLMSGWKRIFFVVVALHRCHSMHLRPLLRPGVSLIGQRFTLHHPSLSARLHARMTILKNQNFFLNETRGTTIG